MTYTSPPTTHGTSPPRNTSPSIRRKAMSFTYTFPGVVLLIGLGGAWLRASPSGPEALAPAGLEQLSQQVSSGPVNERIRAIQAIGELGASAAPAIPLLLEALGDSKTPNGEPPRGEKNVSWYARAALVKVGGPALDACIDSLRGADDFRKRQLIPAIGEFKDRRPCEAILPALGSPKAFLRTIAIRTLLDQLRGRTIGPQPLDHNRP